MNVTREAIYSALFALVSNLPGIVTSSRRLRHWTDVSPDEQPALFQAQIRQTAAAHTGAPTKWLLRADLYLYANSGQDPNAVPATALNNLMDAIEAALAPGPGQTVQNLGGIVHYCRISGEVMTDEGVLGAQAVAIIPVEILTM